VVTPAAGSDSSASVRTAALVVSPAAETVVAAQTAAATPSASVIPWVVQVSGSGPTGLNALVAGFFDAVQSLANQLPIGAPLQDLVNGAVLLVRRSLFNQAPTVSSIQFTGMSDTLITGHVDAVDPEGDPIVYALAKGPSSGSLQLNADGSFTYTPGTTFDGVDSFVVSAQDVGFHLNLADPLRGPGTAASALLNEGAITFHFDFGTGAEYWTPDRQAALVNAATMIVKYFQVNQPVTLSYSVTGTYTPNVGSLASAGSDLISDLPGFWPTVVQNKVITGVDANGPTDDGYISWNWGYSWSLGDTVAAGTYDFESTVMHELLHSFGFLSYAGAPGTNSTPTGWTTYDSFLSTSNGTRVILPNYTWSAAFVANMTGAAGGLYFGGQNASAAYNGQPVPLFTPNPWEQGSSVSHLDDDTFTGADQKLMNAQSPTGLGVRVFSPIELGILKDLGYTVLTPGSTGSAVAIVLFLFVRRARRKTAV
jgi:hypothetical protein